VHTEERREKRTALIAQASLYPDSIVSNRRTLPHKNIALPHAYINICNRQYCPWKEDTFGYSEVRHTANEQLDKLQKYDAVVKRPELLSVKLSEYIVENILPLKEGGILRA
jgi:hypothetical protein